MNISLSSARHDTAPSMIASLPNLPTAANSYPRAFHVEKAWLRYKLKAWGRVSPGRESGAVSWPSPTVVISSSDSMSVASGLDYLNRLPWNPTRNDKKQKEVGGRWAWNVEKWCLDSSCRIDVQKGCLGKYSPNAKRPGASAARMSQTD